LDSPPARPPSCIPPLPGPKHYQSPVFNGNANTTAQNVEDMYAKVSRYFPSLIFLKEKIIDSFSAMKKYFKNKMFLSLSCICSICGIMPKSHKNLERLQIRLKHMYLKIIGQILLSISVYVPTYLDTLPN
jgi:chloramphenicol O-acetyltransferase